MGGFGLILDKNINEFLAVQPMAGLELMTLGTNKNLSSIKENVKLENGKGTKFEREVKYTLVRNIIYDVNTNGAEFHEKYPYPIIEELMPEICYYIINMDKLKGKML